VSATMRRAYAMPKTTPAMAAARRRVLASWLASAPMARNMAAPATSVTEKYRHWPRLNPADGDRPVTMAPRAVSTNKASNPAPRPASA